MARQLNRLSARTVATVKKPGRHADGGGLYLVVDKSGAKRCVFLSCNSAQHLAGQATGIGSELTYVEAAEAASFISAKLDVLSSADYATLLRAVDDSMRALQKRRNVRVMLRIGKGGVIVAVVIECPSLGRQLPPHRCLMCLGPGDRVAP